MNAFDNIPRKKAKFQNWMKNSLKIYNTVLQDQVWEIFSEATKKRKPIFISKEQPVQRRRRRRVGSYMPLFPTVAFPFLSPQQTPCEGPSAKEEKPQGTGGNWCEKSEVTPKLLAEDVAESEPLTKKKSKREQKEERQNVQKEKKELRLQSQQQDKKSKEDKCEEEVDQVVQSHCVTVKKKKKRQAVDAVEPGVNGNGLPLEERAGSGPSAKKCKHSPMEEESCIEIQRRNCPVIEGKEDEHQGKFNWKGTIKAVLRQAPDHEIAIKKLRKKVLAQYFAVTGNQHKSEEEILALFNKKVNSNPKFKVLKEKVKLLK
ncbi:cell growth-regulating nucleolar protein isoform X3 [Paroedura picta]